MVHVRGLDRRRWSEGRAWWWRWCTLLGSIVGYRVSVDLGGGDGAHSGARSSVIGRPTSESVVEMAHARVLTRPEGACCRPQWCLGLVGPCPIMH
eukprot:1516632-Rhodomonas_salina.1